MSLRVRVELGVMAFKWYATILRTGTSLSNRRWGGSGARSNGSGTPHFSEVTPHHQMGDGVGVELGVMEVVLHTSQK